MLILVSWQHFLLLAQLYAVKQSNIPASCHRLPPYHKVSALPNSSEIEKGHSLLVVVGVVQFSAGDDAVEPLRLAEHQMLLFTHAALINMPELEKQKEDSDAVGFST